MKRSTLKHLENTPCFTKSALLQFHESSPSSLDKDIQNWIRSGVLIPLKRGLYTLGSFLDRERQPELFVEYVANKIVQPSYLSCDYVLQKHGLLTEAVYGITSITTKSTRKIENDLGHFKYSSVAERLFTGFFEKPYGRNSILEATKSKALFDYIYMRQHAFRGLSEGEFAELRIDFDELGARDWREFKKYVDLCGTKTMASIFETLKRYSR